jgi:hypothetical protein
MVLSCSTCFDAVGVVCLSTAKRSQHVVLNLWALHDPDGVAAGVGMTIHEDPIALWAYRRTCCEDRMRNYLSVVNTHVAGPGLAAIFSDITAGASLQSAFVPNGGDPGLLASLHRLSASLHHFTTRRPLAC